MHNNCAWKVRIISVYCNSNNQTHCSYQTQHHRLTASPPRVNALLSPSPLPCSHPRVVTPPTPFPPRAPLLHWSTLRVKTPPKQENMTTPRTAACPPRIPPLFSPLLDGTRPSFNNFYQLTLPGGLPLPMLSTAPSRPTHLTCLS